MKISNGFNYKVDGNTITPASNFIGILSVKVTVDDGNAQSEPFFMEIRVLTAPNVPPVIVDQQPISITQGSSLLVSLSHLIVVDPDNSYPKDFTLQVLNGTNYTVAGTTITPSPAFIGALSVRVRVNDGTVNSDVYNLLVEVVPATVTPQIIGQQPLIMNEDESITIQFDDLVVSDADDTYPAGFTLQVLPGPSYTVANRTVTPAKNLSGFLNVGVKVTDDDGNPSEAFNLVILINPVNDAPVITALETLPLSYEPGTAPIPISTIFEVDDVDNDHLNLAEVSLQAYTKGFDELLFTNTPTISGFFDADLGKLVLIGYATLEQYRDAIRSVQYNYDLNLEEQGSPGVLPESRTLFIQLNDGQLVSETRSRKIDLETNVEIDIPSAFTPNGDGANETWNVYALSNAHQCEDAIIKVYNKRGFLLFHTVGLEHQWDGTYNGEKLPVDTYYYTIDLKLSYAKRTYAGVVTLLR
jgi:gliding motility-associated-like protein